MPGEPRDFMAENMKVTPLPLSLLPLPPQVAKKELTGRTSASSSVTAARHRAGAVPKYLKVEQGGGLWGVSWEGGVLVIPSLWRSCHSVIVGQADGVEGGGGTENSQHPGMKTLITRSVITRSVITKSVITKSVNTRNVITAVITIVITATRT